MKKRELRKHWLEKREELELEERVRLSGLISNLFFSKVYTCKINVIHVFLPILKFKEVDTWQIIEKLKEESHVKVIIAKSDFESGQMISYYFDHQKERLIENKYGILEPQAGIMCDNLLIDAVLVPLLIFDKKGYRVGYGKGFYDRFFNTCKKDVLKIGLSFFEPIEIIEDVNENDVRLDCSITPKTVYWFKN